MKRWTVAKRAGQWCVFDRGIMWDQFPDLDSAHTWATQNAVADVLYEPGGLTLLTILKRGCNG